MAQPSGPRADHARARQGHRRARRRRHRGTARRDRRRGRAADRGDRGPADGRDERRRRSVRRGQDVPAPGGEVGAGDEEGRRLPAALHRGGEGAGRRRGGVHGGRHQRHHHHGHRQGRRARHRQEHRRRRVAVQQLHRDRPRRDGARREDPQCRKGIRRRHHRAVRSDHAVTGRDGQLRRRDGTRGIADPAADRRGDHVARAHRREDRAAPFRSGGVGEGRVAVGARGRRTARRQAAAGSAGGHREGLRLAARTALAEERAADAHAGEGAREPDAHRLGRLHAAGAGRRTRRAGVQGL